MDNVVKFESPKNDEQDPANDEAHITGEAICTNCKHEWVAVAPVGILNLTCPACNLNHGRFAGGIVPDLSYRCNCGSALYFLLPEGPPMCHVCGQRAFSWADGTAT